MMAQIQKDLEFRFRITKKNQNVRDVSNCGKRFAMDRQNVWVAKKGGINKWTLTGVWEAIGTAFVFWTVVRKSRRWCFMKSPWTSLWLVKYLSHSMNMFVLPTWLFNQPHKLTLMHVRITSNTYRREIENEDFELVERSHRSFCWQPTDFDWSLRNCDIFPEFYESGNTRMFCIWLIQSEPHFGGPEVLKSYFERSNFESLNFESFDPEMDFQKIFPLCTQHNPLHDHLEIRLPDDILMNILIDILMNTLMNTLIIKLS